MRSLSDTGRRKIAVAGGGTAGHVTTGLAVLAEYRALHPDAELFFLGSSYGFESKLAPAQGFRLVTLPSSPFMRQGLAGRLRAGVNFIRSTLAARRVLREEAPDMVLGLGGYASAGGVLAAKLLGIPAFVHEANVVPGLANRLLGSYVDRVFVAWDETKRRFPSERTRLTGNPVSRIIVASAGAGEPDADELSILVAGGSEGSPFLNERVPELLAAVQADGVGLRALHQCGWGDADAIAAEYRRLGVEARVESFVDDMGEAYRTADFAICAAGAITLSELAIQGVPALLVPLAAAAGDHQAPNAKAYSELTGAIYVSQKEWQTGNVATRLATLLSDREGLEALAERARTAAKPDAARAIVDACEDLLADRATAQHARRS